MLKQLKPDRLYFIINIDESYASRIFEVLKEEETKRGNWPEGDISYREWVEQTFGQAGLDVLDKVKSDI
ncbi:MAG TPA: hypothetical protein PKG96_07710 [Bacilli bacterium]|jgi:hypothetical protein|nr:hypothetical protein [Bacilli bacterium]HOH58980.1 hypothetical protein [Bacilli bacterium]HQM07573.1 hypothetical protein [Bacilli bacterium]